MTGLAFPSRAISDREPSYDYGTPNILDQIPIDPALGGPAIDLALMHKDSVPAVVQILPPVHSPLPLPTPHQQYPTRQYSQGPQGDPFAPPPVPAYFPIQPEPLVPPPKQLKRKRKPRREEECGFCQGNDGKNKMGVPEEMVTCDECGRSGHPSCMNLTEIGDVISQYPWKCIECKNCEICREKGDDDRILFCDFCDRGWHMDCVDPPIQEAPTGKWHCPQCPPLPDELCLEDSSPFDMRESSVASTSRLSIQLDGVAYRGKGKVSVVVVSSDDSDSEDDMDVDMMSATARVRTRPRTSGKSKGRTIKLVNTQVDGSVESPTKRTRATASPEKVRRVRLRLSSQKGKRKEREDEEGAKGMFDDILTTEDRDVSKTSIRESDKQLFERSRVLAEAKLAPPLAPRPQSASESPDQPHAGPSRPLRSTVSQQASVSALIIDASISPTPTTPTTPVTNVDPAKPRIRTIRFGDCDIQTWYDAPFPEEYATMPDGRLWICEFCLKYMKSKFGASRHRLKCKARHPPGDEIYRDGNISIFEVDGRKNKIYCQNLCLLSKMFLDHKSLFYDVEPFLFYVITEVDEIGARFVGYFSKEKRSPNDYNVSCIMTLPVRQRQGWGNLLIDFSYLLSKKEQRLGSPEKPLSALGAIGYKKYWTYAVMRVLSASTERPKLEDISQATSMTVEDVYNTLVHLNMISYSTPTPSVVRPSPGQSIKFPKGRKNGVARRHLQRTLTGEGKEEVAKGPFVAPKQYEIEWEKSRVEEYFEAWEAKGYVKLRAEKLQWSPYILSRGGGKTEGTEGTEEGWGEGRNGVNGVSGSGSSGEAAAAAAMFDEPLEGIKREERTESEEDAEGESDWSLRMASQVPNDSAMQYGHMPLPDRRDSNLDTNASPYPALGQALAPHLVPPPAPYSRPPDSYRNSSPNLPHIPPSPLFAVSTTHPSPVPKRKHVDGAIHPHVVKRRRDADDSADYDLDSTGQGAKHWTDDEKSKLFSWLMGPGQDDHWNALRATKNSCLRECSMEVFANKKTYQALKGCYERNFNLFKQIYAFESYHSHSASSIANLPEADRLREYERRLQAARKAGCDVGNITARTIDHWHRVGWYDLFYRRWHGDPATTRPVQSRANGQGASTSATVEDADADDDQTPMDFAPAEPVQMSNGINGITNDRSHPMNNYINPQNLRDIPPLPTSPSSAAGGPSHPHPHPSSASAPSSSDQTIVNIPITQSLLHTYLQFLQVQTQTGKMKLEYMRRREEREERESAMRRDIERMKMERETAEFEHNKQTATTKQKMDRAIEVLGNPSVEPGLKQAAGDYLKRLFMD
ncbi:hypothetical protein APHAL10511_007373 [Amanita phalloides]|nr:hypothetical protein APHAL10511_007373 [Amanita phalloides]